MGEICQLFIRVPEQLHELLRREAFDVRANAGILRRLLEAHYKGGTA